MANLTITCTGLWGPEDKDGRQTEIGCKNEDCPFQYKDVDIWGTPFTSCYISFYDEFNLDKGNILTITETIPTPEAK